jgi:hypothetical protein
MNAKLLLLLTLLAAPAWGQGGELHPSKAAALLGRDEVQLDEIRTRTLSFKALGIQIQEVKAVDRQTGDGIGAAFTMDGQPVRIGDIVKAEIAARATNPVHKLQEELAVQLTTANPGRRIPVVLWLHFDANELDSYASRTFEGSEAATHDQIRALEADVASFVMAQNAETTAPLEAWLRREGFVPTYVSTTAPALFVSLTPDEIRLVAAHPSVDTIYLERFDRKDGNVNSNRAHRTDRVHKLGVRGRNIRVAMLENNGIDPACPHLNVSGWFNAGTPNPDNHIHGTAGCVASQLVSRLGSAPDVVLFSANAASYSDTNITAAADWIASQNIDVTNMSYGGQYSGAMQYGDRYFDYQARFFQDSYVASAGNDGLTNNVGSPATAWNVISVGAFDIVDTGNWSDDFMASFSSAVNPTTGCEKPNVAASGVDVDTLGDSAGGWLTDDYDGTSFSAPFATGNLANGMVLDSTMLTSPEAAMAALMATAWHNIEGVSRLSGQDGAGGIQGAALARAAMANQIASTTVTPASFTATGYYTYNISLKAGDRTRVCIAWGSQANSTYTTNVLDADLDITILAGTNATSGTSYGSSSSFNNNFEIVEFTPPTTGTYTIRVNDFRFDGTSERMGIAWSQKYKDGATARLEEFTSETNAVAGPTIGQANYWMDVVAPNSPSAPYFVAPSGGMTTGFTFPSGQNFSPLDADIWFDYWLSNLFAPTSLWTNPVGTLSSSGTTLSHRMFLPPVPSFVGFDLHHVAITGEVGLPDDVKEISEVHTFTFWPAPTALTVTDDGSELVNLPFTFRFFGVNYSSVYVNMNGNLTFGAASSDFTESSAELHSGPPRIAACWDDLEPNQLGSQSGNNVRIRSISQGTDQLVVEWINVGEFLSGTGSTGANTFRATIKNDDSITLEYRDMTVQDCIVGISAGNNLSTATEVDLTKSGNLTGFNALFEQFAGAGDNLDLDGGIYFDRLVFRPISAGSSTYRMSVDLR